MVVLDENFNSVIHYPSKYKDKDPVPVNLRIASVFALSMDMEGNKFMKWINSEYDRLKRKEERRGTK